VARTQVAQIRRSLALRRLGRLLRRVYKIDECNIALAQPVTLIDFIQRCYSFLPEVALCLTLTSSISLPEASWCSFASDYHRQIIVRSRT
jgi:hypothetical protein